MFGSCLFVGALIDDIMLLVVALLSLSRSGSSAGLPSAHADAFTSTPYCGNPACVVLMPPGPTASRSAWMQSVALEMHLSETAFLSPRTEGGYDLRWFTPTDEVDLCGHATLASAHVLWEVHGLPKDQPIEFHSRSGKLTATCDEEGFIELDFPSAPETAIREDDPDRAQLLKAFPNLAPEDILYVGRNVIGGPGGGDLLAEVTPDAFAGLEYVTSEVEKIVCRVLSVTAAGCPAKPEPGHDKSEYDFSSRGFAPCVGVAEDPVCGSAHCMFGPYWRGRLGKDTMLARVASPRGGDVRVRVVGDRTALGGKAVTTMVGTLLHTEA